MRRCTRRSRRRSAPAGTRGWRPPSNRTRAADRLSEVARHWLRAGPRNARQAWRAARRAAEHAERLNAHDEAAGLLADAVRAQADDPAATDRERYDLWFDRARAAGRAGDDAGSTVALHEAMRLARRLGDVELLGLAAVAPTDGALWVPRAYGTTDAETLGGAAGGARRAGRRRQPATLPGAHRPRRRAAPHAGQPRPARGARRARARGRATARRPGPARPRLPGGDRRELVVGQRLRTARC